MSQLRYQLELEKAQPTVGIVVIAAANRDAASGSERYVAIQVGVLAFSRPSHTTPQRWGSFLRTAGNTLVGHARQLQLAGIAVRSRMLLSDAVAVPFEPASS